MLDWFKRLDKKKEYIIWWSIMMIISLIVLFYTDYKFSHTKIGDDVYELGEIKTGSWRFVSDTGEDIVISNNLSREILWCFDDLTLSIGDEDYAIYGGFDSDFNSDFDFDSDFSYNYYININGDKLNVDGLHSLIGSKEHSILPVSIFYFFVFTTMLSFGIVYPELCWKLQMLFVTEGGKPTDFYLSSTRISSFVGWLILLILFLTVG